MVDFVASGFVMREETEAERGTREAYQEVDDKLILEKLRQGFNSKPSTMFEIDSLSEGVKRKKSSSYVNFDLSAFKPSQRKKIDKTKTRAKNKESRKARRRNRL